MWLILVLHVCSLTGSYIITSPPNDWTLIFCQCFMSDTSYQWYCAKSSFPPMLSVQTKWLLLRKTKKPFFISWCKPIILWCVLSIIRCQISVVHRAVIGQAEKQQSPIGEKSITRYTDKTTGKDGSFSRGHARSKSNVSLCPATGWREVIVGF